MTIPPPNLLAFTASHILPSRSRLPQTTTPNLTPHPPLRFPPTPRRHFRCCDVRPQSTPRETESPTPNSKTPVYRVEVLSSVTELSKSIWDQFATAGCANPFLRHDWLRCLEESGCASTQTGWIPQHIVLRKDEGEVVAIAPAYVKQHSLGEFIFDQDWAEAAYGAGIMYYPKLLLAVPFTPATGRRVLTVEEGDGREKLLKVFGGALLQVCERLRVSSVHVIFCVRDEVEVLKTCGFLERKGVQYHFANSKKGGEGVGMKYRDFEDYLEEFKSKRRIKMRRERKVVREESGLRIEVVRGTEIDSKLLEQMFHIYKSTIDKLYYGRQYLTMGFFELLGECEEFKEHICLVLARRREDGEVIGGTFNVVGKDNEGAFYGRYWGCVEEYRYLHFEACYYATIEYCIEQGLSRMEPGAGGGEFKFLRGFEPCVTYSMHYLRDERLSVAVENFLLVESVHVDGAVDEMTEKSAIRSKEKKT